MEVIKDHKARNVLIEELKKEPKPPTIPKYGFLSRILFKIKDNIKEYYK